MEKGIRIFHKVIFCGIMLLLTALLLETSIELILNNSGILKIKRENFFRDYYVHYDKNIVQFMPDCARYDQELGYTLKPGVCQFVNREFHVEYRINSIGVRDDEASLSSPEIVVIGDSQAMGWGIKQHETFAKMIEKETGMLTLNAAVSSYGTVRELKMLKRVNVAKLKYLLIQYADNDFNENAEYYNNENVLPIMSEKTYAQYRKDLQDNIKYHFMKHSLYVLNRPINSIKNAFSKLRAPASPMKSSGSGEAPNNRISEPEAFLNALMTSPVNLGSIKIFVFEINGYAHNDSDFVKGLKALISNNREYPEFIKNMVILDFAAQLTADKYFVLDDHLIAKGHRIISNEIVPLIKEDCKAR